MYKAVFYQDLTSFNTAKTTSTVLESFEPLLMVIVDDASPNPGRATKIKNTILFSSYDEKPTNKAVVTLSAIGGTTAEAATAWMVANKVTVLRDLFNFGKMIVEIPKGLTYASLGAKMDGLSWYSGIEEDLLLQAEPCYAFTYGQHWHLGNVEAQEAWNLMSPYADNNATCFGDPDPVFAPPTGSRTIGINDCCYLPEVVLLDEGVQTAHPDLVGRLGTCGCESTEDPVFAPPSGTRASNRDQCTNSWNIVNNNYDVNPQSTYERHGTPLAGIISANNLNQNYTMSVSNNYVKTQVLRIGYRANAANWFYTTPAWALEGLYRAQANTSCAAVVIPWTVTSVASVSAMTAIIGPVLEYMATQARNCTGIPIFAAAGNSNTTDLPYPAADPFVYAIGASDSTNARAYFSNKGSGIFAAAPGLGIRTTDRTGPAGFSTALADPSLAPVADINFTNYAQTLFNGTSASAAIMGSITACLRAVNPALTVGQIQTIFEDTSLAAVDLGNGIVRMQDAVQAAIDLISPVEDLTVTVGINSITPNPAVICGGLAVVETEVAGSGATWGQVTAVTLEYYASADNFLTSTDFLLDSHTFPINNTTDLYTWPLTISNNTSLLSTTKLIVRATLHTNCGQIISNGATEFISSATGFTITYANCPGTDLAVEILSVNITPSGRLFQVKYTNTGTVPITTTSITRGWVGGASSTSTLTWTGTTSATSPIQPGQSRIVNQTYNTPPSQFPATGYFQINTVNGGTDFNPTNNYSTITVNQ
jgi:hypothetical protein